MKTTSAFISRLLASFARVSFVPLTAVALHAACTPPPAGIVGWWKGDGTAMDVVAGNNGTLVNAGYASGVVGQAFSFDPENLPYGTYSGITISDLPAYALTNALTIESWIRPRGDGYYVFYRGDNRPGLDPYGLSMQANHTLLFGICDANGNSASVGASVPYNSWTHVAATLDGSAGTLSIYTNGVLAAQAITSIRPFGNLIPGDSPGVGIGNLNDGFNNFPFLGDIDEVSLYNRALSANEIAAIYNAGSAGKCAGTPVASGVPAIYNFSPAAGSNGTVVAIVGTNFSTSAASNIIYFGAVRAAVLAASANSLTVTVPPGAKFGPITETVGGYTAYSQQMFEPTFAGASTNSVTTASFAPSFNLPANGPGSCVIADLDGDGKPDLAFVDASSQSVTIYRNITTNGALLNAGSFAPRVDLPFPSGTGNNAYRLRAVDLDGDGKLDLIACEVNGSNVTVFHNISSPGALSTNSFEAAFDLAVGNDCRFAATADLDGDGRVDIVALNYGDKTISLLKNIGTTGVLNASSFAPQMVIPAPGGPYEVAIADLDGDGKPDLAVANSDAGSVSIFQNAGGALSNAFPSRIDFPTGDNTATIAVADLDGDGKLDIIAGSVHTENISVFRNVNTGGPLTTNSFATRVDFATGYWTHTVAIADFNGDGKPDIVVVGELPSVMSVFQNVSTPGSFTSASLAPRVDFGTGWNAWGVAAGDLDGDGRPDIVFCNYYDSTVQIYQNVMPLGVIAPPPSCTPAAAGLAGWWRGEGDATDSAGMDNGILLGGLTFAAGEVGQGFNYTQTNQSVRIPASSALDVGAGSGFTLEAWINPTDVTQSHPIFEWNDGNFWGVHFHIEPGQPFNSNPGPGELYANVVDSSGGWHQLSSPGGVVSSNAFQHVALTYDKTSGVATIYWNAQVVGQANLGGFTPLTSAHDLYLGERVAPAGEITTFAGIIDEPSIYNRALAANEIAAIYNAGSAGKCFSLFAPAIISQPTNLTVTADGTATFAVAASGTQPLYYYWSFNHTNFLSGTNSTLTLNNVQPWQSGNYSVTVVNAAGSVVSSNAVLTVQVPQVPPIILAQTPNQFVFVGNPVTFSVVAGGSAPLNYFWNRNGVSIPGATNANYTLLNAQLVDSGSKFNCLVTNAYGSASSTNAMLKVLNTLPNDLCSGAIIITNANYTNLQSTLKATSIADPTPDCIAGFGHGVWYEFTAPVSGLLVVDTFGSDFDTGLALYTGSCDSLTEAACNDDYNDITSQVTLPTSAGATYFILAGGYASDAGNLVLHLNHFTPPAFVLQPTNISVIVSGNGSFGTTLTGSLPISLQWFFNNTPLTDGGRISGSTNSTLNIVNVQTNDGGNYYLVASNFVGVTTSSVAVLTPIILPPTISTPPVSQSVLTGSSVNFFAVISGTPPYNFQWSFNGNPLTDDGVHIIGSSTSSLTISNLMQADAGSYSLLVTNVSGSASAAATLTVLVPPSITAQPVGRSVPPCLPTIFSATASGIPTPSYQWFLNGTNLAGATFAAYTNAAIGSNDLGYYQVVASNSVGTATSVLAQLTFGPVAAWGRNVNNECLPPPGLSNVVGLAGTYQNSFAVRADGTIAAWGNSARTNIPVSATNVVSLFTDGNTGFAALRADGTLAMWGVSAPTILSNVVSVAMGFYANFALRAEGTVVGWGNLPYSTVPAGLNHVSAIAAGYSHALALRSDGSLVAWGAGAATNVPTGLSNVIAIAAGATHCLALKANSSVVAWGSGTGTNLPAGLTNIVAISSSMYVQTPNLCLALRANGTVVAWGDNPYGETNPPPALSNLLSVAIAAVPNHGLALVNNGSPQILRSPIGLTAYLGRDVTLQASAVGAAPLSYQWLLNGTNVPNATNSTLSLPNIQFASAGNYQLFVSNSIATAISLPAAVNVISNSTLTFLTQTTAGVTNYQAARVSVGSVTVLGSGPLTYQWYSSPTNRNYTAVPGGTNDMLVLDPAFAWQSGNYFVAVSNLVGGITSAPVSAKILFARAWGYNAVSNPPVNVTNAVAVATGGATGNASGLYLALGADGRVTSWANYSPIYGETNVSALTNYFVTAIAAGYENALALKSDGTVYAWGYNAYGQTNVPSGLSAVTAIACGGYHDVALKSDGTVVGWGAVSSIGLINYGQATNNPAATNVVAIAAGNLHSLALRADGSVVAWGYTGDGTTIIPASATNVVGIAAGSSLSVALRANGTVVQWGNGLLSYPAPLNLSNIVAVSAAGAHVTALKNDGTVVSWGNAYNSLASNAVPADVANVAQISSGGDHDFALLGTRAPIFTIQPWNRTVPNTTTSVWFSGKCVGVQPITYQWQLNGTNIPTATNDMLTVNATRNLTGGLMPLSSGAYQLIVSNAYGVVASKYAKLEVVIPLGVALNATNLSWTTFGNATWYGQTNYAHDGVSAARSGGIGGLQESDLQTTLATNVAGTVSFWWKVSSEQYFDTLEFRINGTVQSVISGEQDWQQASFPISAGTNVLLWRYSKDPTFDSGLDAGFVDQFGFVSAPAIVQQPASITVNQGATASLAVAATGTPTLGYQWTQNGNPVGANAPVLTMNNVGRAQDGVYSVTVTNNGGATISSNAVVYVKVPQVLGAPTLLSNGALQLTSTDASGGTLSPSDLPRFEAQASPDLANWVTLPNALSLTNGMLQLQDAARTNYPTRYYRIIEH